MTNNQDLIELANKILSEQKIPLIDEKIYDKFKIKTGNSISFIKFVYENDENIIQGFLGLADFFHPVVFKEKKKFFIINGKQIYVLESV